MSPCRYADDFDTCTGSYAVARLIWPFGRLDVCSDHIAPACERLRDNGLERLMLELLPPAPRPVADVTYGRRAR